MDYLFWAFFAGFALVALWVARLASRLASLERRVRRLGASVK